MLINVDPNRDFDYHVGRASVARDMTLEERNDLAAWIEINCEGLTDEQVVYKLAQTERIANPDPVTFVDRGWIKKADLWYSLDRIQTGDGLDLGPLMRQLSASYGGNPSTDPIGAGCYRIVNAPDEIDMRLPEPQAFGQALLLHFGVSQDDYDRLFKVALPRDEIVEGPSPLEQLGFGSGAIVDVLTVSELRGE